jgi:hypothetical protein
MDDNLAFWTFLYSAKVESNPPRVTVDLRELRKRAGSALAMGFADEQDENVPEDLRYISAEVQPIYRAWGVREAELDKSRPYFSEGHLRAKILPLEIVRTTREDREKIAPTKAVARQQPLTLKKRGSGGANA